MNKTGSQIRKGKAMLKRNTLNITISYRPYDLQGTSMPTAEKADWFIPAEEAIRLKIADAYYK